MQLQFQCKQYHTGTPEAIEEGRGLCECQSSQELSKITRMPLRVIAADGQLKGWGQCISGSIESVYLRQVVQRYSVCHTGVKFVSTQTVHLIKIRYILNLALILSALSFRTRITDPPSSFYKRSEGPFERIKYLPPPHWNKRATQPNHIKNLCQAVLLRRCELPHINLSAELTQWSLLL